MHVGWGLRECDPEYADLRAHSVSSLSHSRVAPKIPPTKKPTRKEMLRQDTMTKTGQNSYNLSYKYLENVTKKLREALAVQKFEM